jgi:hypothetical protein
MTPEGKPSALHVLPCGAEAYWDETGMRCLSCFAIYGSIGCGCSNEARKVAKGGPSE